MQTLGKSIWPEKGPWAAWRATLAMAAGQAAGGIWAAKVAVAPARRAMARRGGTVEILSPAVRPAILRSARGEVMTLVVSGGGLPGQATSR